MTVALFIAFITIIHIVGYAAFVYWTTQVKASGDVEQGEIIDHEWDGVQEVNNPMPKWWLNMFYGVIVWGALYLIFYPGVLEYKFDGFLGWTQEQQYLDEKAEADKASDAFFAPHREKTVEELSEIPEIVASGRRIFLQNCAVCHGQNAQGAALGYPNLADHDWLWGGDGKALVTSITKGRNTIKGQGMPAGGALINPSNPQADDEEKLEAVAHYVHKLGKREGFDEGLAAKGEELYNRSCVACHGKSGEGNMLLGAPNLADDIWLYSYGDIEDIKQFVRKPVNNVMPAWESFLDEMRIKVVAAYVQSLSKNNK